MTESSDDNGRSSDAVEADAASWRAAADVVIERLGALAAELSPTERAVLASLLAPSITMASDEVRGFATSAPTLPDGVDLAIREHRLRIVEAPEPPGHS